jgi:hypothetical protein
MGVIYNRNRKKALLFIPSGGLGPSVSAAFSYDKTSYNQSEANPTPTITGTPGGTFSSDAGVSFVSTSTGEIDLSESTIASHTIFYIVDGVQASQTIDITAAPYASTSSFTFDGVNDYFQTTFSIGTTNTFSVSMWVNTTSFTTSQILIDNRDTGADGFNCYINTNNTLQFRINGVDLGVSTSTLSTNTWFHLGLTYNGSDKKIYFNGSKVAETSQSTTLNVTNTLRIGTISQSTPSNFFSGKIDEVSIWDSALSSDAITEIAAGPNDLTSLTNASSSNLKAWYKMGE